MTSKPPPSPLQGSPKGRRNNPVLNVPPESQVGSSVLDCRVVARLLLAMMKVGVGSGVILFLSVFSARAETFDEWRDSFVAQARTDGISEQTLERIVPRLVLDEEIAELDRAQPEQKLSFSRYLRNAVTQKRVEKGRKLLAQHKKHLKTLEKHHGVPAAIVIALWGVESDYGAYTGNRDVFSSLSSLAYDGRRAAFFRNELLEALWIVQENKVDPDLLIGSWAGAMGQCQFMPSTYRRHAADGDKDGQKDIWDSEKDVLASIAKYLAAEGWRAGHSWGRKVLSLKQELSGGFHDVRTVRAWRNVGVTVAEKIPLAEEGLDASILLPDGPGGRALLVYDNFHALLRWNRSISFAASVGFLAESLEKGR